jgi:hypothetical protein
MDVPSEDDYERLDLIAITMDEPWLDRPQPTIRFDIAQVTKAQPCEDLLSAITLYDSYSRTLPLTTDLAETSKSPQRTKRPGEVIPAHNRTPGDPETDTPCNITDSEKKEKKESMRKSRYSDEKKKKWQSHLYISDPATLEQTLLSTTQLAVLETNPELTILKQHGKRRLHKLSQRRLTETFYTDTIVAAPECVSVRGYNYTQLFIGKESHYIRVYNMKKKSQYYPDALCDFITYVGIPKKLISDNAGEEVQAEVRWYLSKLGTRIGTTEPHHQHQNFAEQAIRDIKALFFKIMSLSGAPIQYWCYAVQYAAELLNCRARASLDWRTPSEAIEGETPDISAFYQFMFWQKVRYTMPNIKFPKNSDRPGRFLGIAKTTGDALTYTILDDRDKTKIHITLVRSAVQPDNDQNQLMTRKIRQPEEDPRIKNKSLFVEKVTDNKLERQLAEKLGLKSLKVAESDQLPTLTETIVTATDRIQRDDLKTWGVKEIIDHRIN